MSKSFRYRKIFSVFILTLQLFSFLSLSPALSASSDLLSSKAVFPQKRVVNIAEDIRNGRKVSLNTTIFSSGDDVVPNRYTVFFKKGSKDNVATALRNTQSFNVGGEYGEAIAVPITIGGSDDVDKVLNELESNPDVLAITQVVKRETSAVSVPNDPMYPSAGTYSSSYQWYLNRPASGSYGIDIMRAWQYLDAQGKNWQGDNSIIVAVIDTGLAYEAINKYPYTGGDWGFTESTDNPLNTYVNAGEIASNDLDDDSNGAIEDAFNAPSGTLYCLDANGNGQCESPSERTKSYVDDVNGLNIVDFNNYWNPLNVSSASNCSNAPYTTYKCVPQRVCETVTDSGSNHFGCDITEMGHPNDIMGHGTAVAGVIAGAVGNSIAGAGIAPNVTILPISIFQYVYNSTAGSWQNGSSSGSSEFVARAIEYAVSAGAKIINMSFGGTLPDPYEQLAMERAYEEDNVLLVAASGNRNSSTVDFPAGYTNVMAVGASSMNGTRASYSSYGTSLELVAPVSGGIPIQSYTCYFASNSYANPCLTSNPRPDATSQFTQFSNGLTAGTSFASPQVAAVAALVWTMRPAWTNEQVRYVLKMSAVQTQSSEFSSAIGYGILNAYNAVRGVDSSNRDLTQKGRLYQSVRGMNNQLFDRYSDDHGKTWSAWLLTPVSVVSTPSLIYNASSGRLLQARRNGANGLYVRTSTNFGSSWGSWTKLGNTVSSATLVDTGDKIVLAIRGTDNAIYTRVSSNGGVTWGGWSKSGATKGLISMVYHPGTSRVVQAVRGLNGVIYTRYSSDKGNTWSSWSGGGSTPGNVTLVTASSRVILYVRGGNNRIYSRYSTNGGGSWSSWTSDAVTYGDVSVVYTGSRLVQSATDSNSMIQTRYSTNLGSTWSSWIKGGQTKQPIKLVYNDQFNRITMAVVGLDNGIWVRYSDNGGTSWRSWIRSGSTPNPSELQFMDTENW